MDPYNKQQFLAGIHVDTELGISVTEFPDKRGKYVLERARRLLVQVLCMAPEGNCVGQFNGIFYLGGFQDPLILTVAHCIGWAGATSYRAVSLDDSPPPSSQEAFLQLDLVKHGVRLPGASRPPAVAEYNPGVAVFRVLGQKAETYDLPPPLPPSPPCVGDKVYVVAIAGNDDNARTISMSEGLVSTLTLHKCITTAYAGSEFSGAPVVSGQGFFLGLVLSGTSGNKKTSVKTDFISSMSVEAFLTFSQPVLPGLPSLN